MGYSVIDISDWQYINRDVSGSKEKRWYKSKEKDKMALFKVPISFTSETQTILNEVSGESWSEKMSSEIGKVIGYNVHDVDIATIKLTSEVIEYYGINTDIAKRYNKIHGSLCWSFLKEDESLVEGTDMIMYYDHTYDREKLKGEKEIYNFGLLFRLFNDYSILEELFKMIIFDTLIGNTDRHQDNFGIIWNENTGQPQKFAPLYDNASSLGRELPVKKAEQMLKDKRMFEAYLFGNKSKTLIRWGNILGETKNIFDFYDLVKEKYPFEINEHIQKIEALTNSKVINIINKVPSIIMSDVHKELVYKILIKRRDYLLVRSK